MSVTRATKGGGVAKIFNTSFQCKQISHGDFAYFEHICALVKGSPCILLLTIYRPPKHSAKVFLEEFGELLTNICLSFDCLIISGDFNIHVDNPENTYSKELLRLIDTFGLTQHIQVPTHSHGHTLDLVITKCLDVSTTIKDLALSDHYCIFFDVSMFPHTQNKALTIERRILNDNAGFLFEQALSQHSSIDSDSVDDLLTNFNSKMTQIMDNIAPLKNKRITDNNKAPWKQNLAVKLLKRECRKTERKWRKSNLHVHYQIHKEMLSKYNYEICKARQSFFSNIINKNLNNAHVLFSTVEKLTNKPSQLAPELLSVDKCNEFASFFRGKIDKIRLNITSQISQTLEPMSSKRGELNTMSTFSFY